MIKLNSILTPHDAHWETTKHKRTTFLVGLLAAGLMTAVMLLLQVSGVTPRSLINLIADKVAALTGGSLSELVIQAIGSLGKELLYLGVILGQIAFGGLLGFLFGLVNRKISSRAVLWRNSFIMSSGTWLFFLIVGFPLLDVGFLGSSLGNDRLYVLLSTFLLFQLFGLLFAQGLFLLLPPVGVQTNPGGVNGNKVVREGEAKRGQENHRQLQEASTLSPDEDEDPAGQTEMQRRWEAGRTTRRSFIGLLGAVSIVVTAIIVIPRIFFTAATTPFKNRATFGRISPVTGRPEGEVTATEDFYVVTKNALDPPLSASSWTLEFDGLVQKPMTLKLDDLRRLPQQTQYHTLECISNAIGGELMGTAKWSGVPLALLLAQTEVKPEGKWVLFTCADGYTDSFPLEKALEPNTLLALEMNDMVLTPSHGFPARILAPNLYGEKNVKWVTKITLIDHDYMGFWQKQGWTNVGTTNALSTIVSPTPSDTLKAGQSFSVRGIAFAGSRTITKVELSTDNAQSWQSVNIFKPLNSHAWTIWQWDWTPESPGKEYKLVVRAYEDGKVQTADKNTQFPNGSSGYHVVTIKTN